MLQVLFVEEVKTVSGCSGEGEDWSTWAWDRCVFWRIVGKVGSVW